MKKKVLALVLAAIVAIGAVAIFNLTAGGKDKMQRSADFHDELLGENVYIFSPEDDQEEIQKVLDEIYTVQETNQFGDKRYAIYFLPGEYDEVNIPVGFYEMIAGLGTSPEDTTIAGLESLARWLGDDPGNHNACCNFWRGVENITIDSDTVWAVSQATDVRRIKVNGSLALHDEHGWCSGGFLADSVITGNVDSGSQQQWLSRNNNWASWTGENWNMVFVGEDESIVPEGSWPEHPYTSKLATDEIREKPFLVYDKANGYGVYVPGIREDAVGASFENGVEEISWTQEPLADAASDVILCMDSFYIAKPEVDNAKTINEQLAAGKHLLLTPGIYEIDEPIKVVKENTVVLGLGLATLESTNGNACMEVADVSGVSVSGILFEAGLTQSENLMIVGEAGSNSSKEVPIQLSDLYFRIGGPADLGEAKTKNAITINSSDVIGDNFWVWRADHGDTDITWYGNVAENGLTVNGDNVAIYGLMVEHFEEYQTIWNGNGGRIYMYQSEIPYDVPEQSVWMSHDGERPGYSSIYVADDVQDFYAMGLGIYLYNRDELIRLESAVELPDREGVIVENICTVMLTGYPGMVHVINDSGQAVLNAGERRVITYYENGEFREN